MLLALYLFFLLPLSFRYVRARPDEFEVLKDKYVRLARPKIDHAAAFATTRPTPLSSPHISPTPRAGWIAILGAMVVSSIAGVILERFVREFEGIAVLAPLINGVGGSLAVVYASKISTSLHAGHRCV